ncbi:MAG TPA: prolyl oligopeptidase family serine peptidase [Planctomycetota bacterium]|nr:prolyl oligopeptidase family serine peptidase [Planctomycetota bacterium]
MWNLDELTKPPAVFPAPGISERGVEALFYAGEDYRGKPTRVFAWYGEPSASAGDQVPAMVLVHGGGGTAFAEWVRMWTSRGYIAIAMDTCGSIGDTRWGAGDRQQHEWAGPRGWGGFDQMDGPLTDHWCYHAVAAVMRAVSHLTTRSRVDVKRIGITGVSWGGFLTSLTVGVDPRFACAMPVYGCGFITEDSTWNDQFKKLGPEKTGAWRDHFDPGTHLGNARAPMLWLNGTNDFAYFPSSWQKSYRQTMEPRTLCMKLRMPHGHGGAGENAWELPIFAERWLKGGPGLATITKHGQEARVVWAEYDAPFSLHATELLFTRDVGRWPDRKWETQAAQHDAGKHRVSATVPEGATAWYLTLTDFRGLMVSSEHQTSA